MTGTRNCSKPTSKKQHYRFATIPALTIDTCRITLGHTYYRDVGEEATFGSVRARTIDEAIPTSASSHKESQLPRPTRNSTPASSGYLNIAISFDLFNLSGFVECAPRASGTEGRQFRSTTRSGNRLL
jgi:hypothetical protein